MLLGLLPWQQGIPHPPPGPAPLLPAASLWPLSPLAPNPPSRGRNHFSQRGGGGEPVRARHCGRYSRAFYWRPPHRPHRVVRAEREREAAPPPFCRCEGPAGQARSAAVRRGGGLPPLRATCTSSR